MKRIMIVAVSVMVVTVLVFGASIAMAAKPDGKNGTKDVIAMSNGFPSGPHFNLNIHGKKDSFVGDPTSVGGHSVFTLEYGEGQHIQYVSNKKSSATELTVLDKYTEAFDGDPALVQLPREPEGYYVFARILGKPNNGQDAAASSIILYPNVVVSAQNYEDDLLGLGLIIKDAVYEAKPEEFVRFDLEATNGKGKGKSKAVDITRLFTYAGWVVDARLDLNEDGVIDENDLDLYNTAHETSYDTVENWLIAMSELDSPMAWYFSPDENMWIFNIADLVITEQGLENDGTKLVQIRFYPVATTLFSSE